MTTLADTRISDERLQHVAIWATNEANEHRTDDMPVSAQFFEDTAAIITELRERRAQAVAVEGLAEIKALVVAAFNDSRIAKSNLNAAAHKLSSLISALASPPPLAQSADAAKDAQAVAVAWGAPGMSCPLSGVSLEPYPGFNIPLYTSSHPAPASVGVSEEMIQRGRDWFNDNFNGMPDSYALVRGILAAAITQPAGKE